MNNQTLNYNQDPHQALQDNSPQPQLLQPNRQAAAQPATAQYTLIHPAGTQPLQNIGQVQQSNPHLLAVAAPQHAGAQPMSAVAPTTLTQFQPVPAPIAVTTSTAPQHAQAHQTIPAQQAVIHHQPQQVLLQPQHHQQQHAIIQQQQPVVQHQLPLVQQFDPQQTNQALLQTFMTQKAQLAAYESQLRQRFLPNQSAEPVLQSQLLGDPRLMMGQIAAPVLQNPVLPVGNPQQQIGAALPSPHELTLRDDTRRMRGGVIEPFPEKLHRLLLEVEAAGRADVISFIAGGKAFAIHNSDTFFKEIVPKYFRQSRLSSFKRQLNLYGFELINTGPARGGYFHEFFVKDRPELCRRMRRVAVKLYAKQQEKKQQEGEKRKPTDPEETSEKKEEGPDPPAAKDPPIEKVAAPQRHNEGGGR